MELQRKGIDVELETEEKNKILVDDKCALYYANKNLQTFTFELSFLNQRGDVREGWLINPKLSTTHYNIMWLETEDKQLKPTDIEKEDILVVESMIISKETLFDYLDTLGLTVEELRMKAINFRESGDTRLMLTPHIELINSPRLAESPINLKIKKTELDKIADYHLKVHKKGLYDLKNHSSFKKKRETRVAAPPGFKAEKTVYEAIKKYFYGRECVTYMHFPIHNHNFQGRREMDILVVDR